MPSVKSDARWRDAIFITIAVWLFVALMFLPVILDRHSSEGWLSGLLDLSTFIPSILLGFGTFAVFRATIEWNGAIRTPALAAALVVAAVSQTVYDLAFAAWIATNLDVSWAAITVTPPYEKIFRYLLVFTVNLVLFQLATTRRRSQRSERQLLDARSAAQHAQLEALRYQLNPHFLFNTLNSISSLIVTRRNEDAEHMTNKLSSFLRSSLTCDPAGLITLDEELALIEEYLDIEAVRFGQRLNIEIESEANCGCVLIPGFLVQPLVENAIKHGVAPSREPVTVRIRATLEQGLLCITVENDIVQLDERIHAVGSGVGLANVRQRLAAVYGDAASLTTGPVGTIFRATICIPGVKSKC